MPDNAHLQHQWSLPGCDAVSLKKIKDEAHRLVGSPTTGAYVATISAVAEHIRDCPRTASARPSEGTANMAG